MDCCKGDEYCSYCLGSCKETLVRTQYSALSNFKRWLARFQALTEPPKPIPEAVMAMGHGVKHPKELHEIMRRSKGVGSKYLQWIPYILKRHGNAVPMLRPEVEAQLCETFKNFNRLFVKPEGRKILPHCSFLARKMLIELGELELADRVCDIREGQACN